MRVLVCFVCVYTHNTQRVQNSSDNVATLRFGVVDDTQMCVCISICVYICVCISILVCVCVRV